MSLVPLILFSTLLGQQPSPSSLEAPSEPWTFILPDNPTDPHASPPPRAIVLSREKPEDVVERVQYKSDQPRYAQLRYGGPSSVRVTIVLDEPAPGQADLYVDSNRNRRIEPRDRVTPDPDDPTTWRLPSRRRLGRR